MVTLGPGEPANTCARPSASITVRDADADERLHHVRERKHGASLLECSRKSGSRFLRNTTKRTRIERASGGGLCPARLFGGGADGGDVGGVAVSRAALEHGRPCDETLAPAAMTKRRSLGQ